MKGRGEGLGTVAHKIARMHNILSFFLSPFLSHGGDDVDELLAVSLEHGTLAREGTSASLFHVFHRSISATLSCPHHNSCIDAFEVQPLEGARGQEVDEREVGDKEDDWPCETVDSLTHPLVRKPNDARVLSFTLSVAESHLNWTRSPTPSLPQVFTSLTQEVSSRVTGFELGFKRGRRGEGELGRGPEYGSPAEAENTEGRVEVEKESVCAENEGMAEREAGKDSEDELGTVSEKAEEMNARRGREALEGLRKRLSCHGQDDHRLMYIGRTGTSLVWAKMVHSSPSWTSDRRAGRRQLEAVVISDRHERAQAKELKVAGWCGGCSGTEERRKEKGADEQSQGVGVVEEVRETEENVSYFLVQAVVELNNLVVLLHRRGESVEDLVLVQMDINAIVVDTNHSEAAAHKESILETSGSPSDARNTVATSISDTASAVTTTTDDATPTAHTASTIDTTSADATTTAAAANSTTNMKNTITNTSDITTKGIAAGDATTSDTLTGSHSLQAILFALPISRPPSSSADSATSCPSSGLIVRGAKLVRGFSQENECGREYEEKVEGEVETSCVFLHLQLHGRRRLMAVRVAYGNGVKYGLEERVEGGCDDGESGVATQDAGERFTIAETGEEEERRWGEQGPNQWPIVSVLGDYWITQNKVPSHHMHTYMSLISRVYPIPFKLLGVSFQKTCM